MRGRENRAAEGREVGREGRGEGGERRKDEAGMLNIWTKRHYPDL